MCGVRNQNSLKKLLSQDKKFDECLAVALADEAADKESKGLLNENVHFTKGIGLSSSGLKSKKRGNKCYRCGSENHYADKCHVKNLKCDYCHKSNHTSRECFKRKNFERRDSRGIRYIDTEEIRANEEPYNSEFTGMFEHLNTNRIHASEIIDQNTPDYLMGPTLMINSVRQSSYKTEVALDGQNVTMEMDGK